MFIKITDVTNIFEVETLYDSRKSIFKFFSIFHIINVYIDMRSYFMARIERVRHDSYDIVFVSGWSALAASARWKCNNKEKVWSEREGESYKRKNLYSQNQNFRYSFYCHIHFSPPVVILHNLTS